MLIINIVININIDKEKGINNMFNQTEYQGMDIKKMEKDFKRMTKQYQKMGNSLESAQEKAKDMVEYYKHQYRIFA